MLIQLIKKDLTYLAVSLKVTLLLIILFALFMPMANISYACVMPALVCYIGFYSVFAYEERNKMDLLNASLPVRRRDICLAKYIHVLIIVIGTCILSIIGVSLSPSLHVDGLLGYNEAVVQLLPIMLSIAMIYSAIVLPCLFYFGTIKTKYVLMTSYILIFIGINSIDNEKMMDILQLIKGIGRGGASIIGLLVSMLIFILSYQVSLHIWAHKEF